MGYEIEFFPVGEASKAGDAITVRYGEHPNYSVVIIDGGTDHSGEAIVSHVRNVYGNVAAIDVINTHPDADHACGLRHVVRELPVRSVWLHGLWHHAPRILELFEDRRWTAQSLTDAIRREYPVVEELINIATERSIPVYEPFLDATIGPFRVLSPTIPTYQHLLPQFRKTPAPNTELLKARNIWLGDTQKQSIFVAIAAKVQEAVTNWIDERWDIELLKEGGVTAAENESSVVLFGEFGPSSKVLLTADAGVNALRWACENAQQRGVDLSNLALVQVPHHGSRRNVAPSVLDRIVGPRVTNGSLPTKTAVVSAPNDDENHPRKMVLNAFTRRGAAVHSTQGIKFRFHHQMPGRPNEGQSQPLGFFNRVEAYD